MKITVIRKYLPLPPPTPPPKKKEKGKESKANILGVENIRANFYYKIKNYH